MPANRRLFANQCTTALDVSNRSMAAYISRQRPDERRDDQGQVQGLDRQRSAVRPASLGRGWAQARPAGRQAIATGPDKDQGIKWRARDRTGICVAECLATLSPHDVMTRKVTGARLAEQG